MKLNSSSSTFLAGCVSFLEIDDMQEADEHKGKLSVVQYTVYEAFRAQRASKNTSLHSVHVIPVVQEMYSDLTRCISFWRLFVSQRCPSRS